MELGKTDKSKVLVKVCRKAGYLLSDMDGVMSAAIVYNKLKELGYKADVLFHSGKQHGCLDLLDDIIGEYDTLIIPDAGSQDEYAIKQIREFGTNVIIFDHHEYNKWDFPDNVTLINCKDWPKGNNLSGGAVANYSIVGNQMDLAALSIVSDVMPLNDVYNRYVVKHGLAKITNPFLQYLVDKLNKGVRPTPKWIGWTLAPLVNAVQRSNNQDAKELLFRAFVNEADFDDALAIMRKCKREQDNEVKTMLESIEPDNSHKFVVAFGDESTAMYTGLVANKLLSKYNKPALLLREQDSTQYCGSMRSPIPILDEINASGLAVCQGHQSASGITIKKSQLPRLLQWADNLDIDMSPVIDVAAELNFSEINIGLCDSIEEHNDLWGMGIEEPLFYSKFIANQSDIAIYRKASNTLRINVDGVSFIKFRIDDGMTDLLESGLNIEFELTYHLAINEYNGNRYCQGMIQDMEWKFTNKEEPSQYDWDSIFG